MSVKQVIVMRTDLNMRKGKMVVQGAHATMGIMLKTHHPHLSYFHLWVLDGAAKICVGVDTLEELVCLEATAEDAGIINYLVTDAGRTEFSEPTITCLAIGPAESKEIDKITGHLKLL